MAYDEDPSVDLMDSEAFFVLKACSSHAAREFVSRFDDPLRLPVD